MAPSCFKKIGAAVACASAVNAATESYQVTDEYTPDNFFDKFDFFVSSYTSDDSWDATHGYVQYLGQADAESAGLISTSSDNVYIGPDHTNTYDPEGRGRKSVRIESKATYNQGLMIARFAHMPAQACGAWPAFWSYGSPWLTSGEMDFYEGWNEQGYNRMAMHTNGTLAGSCSLTTSGVSGAVMTADCVNGDDMAGCGVEDGAAVWGSTTGAVVAREWTDAAIRFWSWLPDDVPADVADGAPTPGADGWGEPTLLVEAASCDLAASFADQQLVFNIDFCGDSSGSDYYWNQTCSASTGTSCAGYVANNPSAFADTFFKVEGIQFFEKKAVEATSASSVVASTSSTVAVSSATTSSSSSSSGLLAGTGSVLESTLGASSTAVAISVGISAAAAAEASQTHTTSYIYGTSTSTDDNGSETTVVVVVDTTICPVTAAEATASGRNSASQTTTTTHATATSENAAAAAAASSLSSSSSSSSTAMTTSTIFSTSSSTITSCASTAAAASSCSVGGVTTVVVAVSTTVCPVTAAEASASGKASSISGSSKASTVAASGLSSPQQSQLTSARHSSATASKGSSSSSSSSSYSFLNPSDVTVSYASSTEVVSPASATGSSDTLVLASPTASAVQDGSNSTATGTSTAAASSSSCSGMDCIVVSSSGGKTASTVGAGSGFALVVLAGAMFMF